MLDYIIQDFVKVEYGLATIPLAAWWSATVQTRHVKYLRLFINKYNPTQKTVIEEVLPLFNGCRTCGRIWQLQFQDQSKNGFNGLIDPA
jgi:hypothetical protein